MWAMHGGNKQRGSYGWRSAQERKRTRRVHSASGVARRPCRHSPPNSSHTCGAQRAHWEMERRPHPIFAFAHRWALSTRVRVEEPPLACRSAAGLTRSDPFGGTDSACGIGGSLLAQPPHGDGDSMGPLRHGAVAGAGSAPGPPPLRRRRSRSVNSASSSSIEPCIICEVYVEACALSILLQHARQTLRGRLFSGLSDPRTKVKIKVSRSEPCSGSGPDRFPPTS